MKKLLLITLLSAISIQMFSQETGLSPFPQNQYSPAYFGPNANPVPDFTAAIIPEFTTLSVAASYSFGFGDRTINPPLTIEIPLLPKKVSLKLWLPLMEYYSVTPAVYDYRKMEGKLSGSTSGGDIYVQTRMLLFSEKRTVPAVVLNSTLRSASGGEFEERRYFDTPGYYFDVEIAKSFPINTEVVSDIRLAADLGFMCWETSGSTQNDATMYGAKIILSNKSLDFENTISGYSGWMKNGDQPLVFTSKLNGKLKNFRLFLQYKYGITDWNYHQLQAGVSFDLKKLTPKYN
ncbi:MAG: hypothetical protein LBV75_02410, partial [Paludibacter sp.]|jgi:hypothetical protein|nr:hypothetical protein [Paludibacter sp.]